MDRRGVTLVGGAMIWLVVCSGAPPAAASPEREAAKHLAAAHTALEEGDLNRAAEELRASAAQKPIVKTYLLLGNAYVKLGQLDGAREAFQKVLGLKPKPAQKKSVEQVIAELELLKRTSLQITSTPPGATVYVDLKSEGARGKTPLTLPMLPGPHRVILELDGYNPTTLPSVQATEGQVIAVNATLRLHGCSVRIAATQPGVKVSIDGTEATAAPASLVLAPGTHHVELAGEGLKAKVRSIRCEGEQPLELEETLEPLPKASLALVVPDRAEVRVDDRVVAAAEAGHLSLDAGTHRLQVKAEGKAPWQTEVTLRQGESATLTPALAAQLAAQPSLTVGADAPDVIVMIDGKRVEPRSRVATSIGAHTVEIYGKGRDTFRDQVVLGEGESARIDARLKWRGNTALVLGLTCLLLAAGAEGVGVAGHYASADVMAGSSDYKTWNSVAQGGFYGGAAIGGVGLVLIVVGLVQANTGGLPR